VRAGVGLLYYGQNYLIYPAAFPPGARTGACPRPAWSSSRYSRMHDPSRSRARPVRTHDARDTLSRARAEVPTPADFGLPYADLVLTTPDGVTLRSYLLVQKRDLGAQAAYLDTYDYASDAEVHLLPFPVASSARPQLHGAVPRTR
jgi:hypothetical protein